MVIHNLNVVGISTTPYKADAPLIVDANAVLSLTIPYEYFKTVAWQCSEIAQRRSSFHMIQLQPSGSNPENALIRFPAAKGSGPLIPKADDH